MDPESPYTYQPLDPSRREIRLLTLLPSPGFDSKLQAELHVASLSSRPKYEALSYVWGDPVFGHEIDIQGRRHFITEHLDYALRYVRQGDTKRVIWVDALCINQKDTLERNSQVAMMRDIYQSCSVDLAWLGPLKKPDDIELKLVNLARKDGDELDRDHFGKLTEKSLHCGMAFFKEIHTHDIATLKVMEKWWKARSLDKNGHFRGPLPDTEGRPIYLMQPRQLRMLKAVFHNPPLWSRMWILQELSCAPKVLLVGGRETLDWDIVNTFLADGTYADAFHGPFDHNRIYKVTAKVFSRARAIDQQRLAMQREGYRSSLLDVLARFRWQKSTDVRDMIYGLLGLVSEKHSLTVDYQKSETDVFVEATEELISVGQNLDILCQNPWEQLGPPRRGHRGSALPSWVVDFTHSQKFPGGTSKSELMFAQRGIFSAGTPTCVGSWQILDGLVLQLHGCLLGKIATRPERGHSNHRSPWPWYLVARFAKDNREIYKATGEPVFQAFWRTSITDCTAYPIRRLDEDDIARGKELFENRLDENWNEEAFPRIVDGVFEELGSSAMWSRNRHNWTLFTSENGLFIMARDHVRVGDVIVVIQGGKVPFILRPVGRRGRHDECFEFVSASYVHGFMDGELPARVAEGSLEQRAFSIV